MKTSKRYLKAFVLSLGLAVGLLLPVSVTAQNEGGGVFGYGNGSTSVASDKVLYICIAPGEYYNFSVSASWYYLNTPFKQKTKSNVTFEAGKIYDLGTFSLN